jgi:hypothetical protein
VLGQREEVETAVGAGRKAAEQLMCLGKSGCVCECSGQVICGVLELAARQSESCLLKSAVGGPACIHEGEQ